MKAFVKAAAVVAVFATGCVKAAEQDSTIVYNSCVNQAKSAYALVHAREMGKPRAEIKNYVKSHEQPRYHAMLNRIIDRVYDNPGLTNDAAYDGELVYCMSHPKTVVVGK